jgi:hypothetical protein
MQHSIPKINNRSSARLLILFAIILMVSSCRSREYPYNISLYKSGQGWGYDISVKDKPYIHQPFMPAIPGEVPFKSRVTARKTAGLMVSKLKEHKLPYITKEELDSLNRE